jgi:hypothetical protein
MVILKDVWQISLSAPAPVILARNGVLQGIGRPADQLTVKIETLSPIVQPCGELLTVIEVVPGQGDRAALSHCDECAE